MVRLHDWQLAKSFAWQMVLTSGCLSATGDIMGPAKIGCLQMTRIGAETCHVAGMVSNTRERLIGLFSEYALTLLMCAC